MKKTRYIKKKKVKSISLRISELTLKYGKWTRSCSAGQIEEKVVVFLICCIYSIHNLANQA